MLKIINKILNGSNFKRVDENFSIVKADMKNTKISQIQLFHQYRELLKNGISPDWKEVGFRVFSQTDEDGILLFIFSMIGFSNKILVDLACGEPDGSNSANLICNWGFYGLLIDGNVNATTNTADFYSNNADTFLHPPKVINTFITAENLNAILVDHGVSGEIDLFLLDVDGIDYWLWDKLDAVNPRVVVVEACSFLGYEKSISVPYSPNFNRFDNHPDFMGASLLAYKKLAEKKGYRLVASNKYGFNLFFVRDDLAKEQFKEISVNDCFYFEPKDLKEKRIKRLESVSSYPWVEV